jgi:hypothetical protein
VREYFKKSDIGNKHFSGVKKANHYGTAFVEEVDPTWQCWPRRLQGRRFRNNHSKGVFWDIDIGM